MYYDKFTLSWSQIVFTNLEQFMKDSGVPIEEFSQQRIYAIYEGDENISEFEEKTKDTWKFGASLGIHKTPQMFYNGKKLLKFPESSEEMIKVLNTVIG